MTQIKQTINLPDRFLLPPTAIIGKKIFCVIKRQHEGVFLDPGSIRYNEL